MEVAVEKYTEERDLLSEYIRKHKYSKDFTLDVLKKYPELYDKLCNCYDSYDFLSGLYKIFPEKGDEIISKLKTDFDKLRFFELHRERTDIIDTVENEQEIDFLICKNKELKEHFRNKLTGYYYFKHYILPDLEEITDEDAVNFKEKYIPFLDEPLFFVELIDFNDDAKTKKIY